MDSTLQEQVTLNYYATTASRAHSASVEYYDSCAANVSRWLRDWLPPDKRALCVDLAAGCGEVQYFLERQGFGNTIGVDLCKEELEQGRAFVRGELVNADILTFLKSAADSSIDFMSALNILEHLDKDYLLEVLKEARRTLRPGASLVAMVPNAVSPFGGLTRHWDITHQSAFTTNSIRQLAALTGFDQSVEFREIGPSAHGPISLIRSILWQSIRFLIAARLMIEVATVKDGIYTMDMLARLRRPLS
jgi:SAM-dependent methyltransferase